MSCQQPFGRSNRCFLEIALSCFMLIVRSTQKCVLTGTDCDATVDPTCHPTLAEGDQINPQIYEYDPGESVCPQYDGKLSCCNKFVMKAMKDNYGLLDATMGDPSNGCSICATNMKRFW